MMTDRWKKIAKQEGRICPECKQPVSKKQWVIMNKSKKISSCWTCRYVHWETGPIGSFGSSRRDNADRDDLVRIRGS